MREQVSSEDATRLASGLVRVIGRLEAERDKAIWIAAQLLRKALGGPFGDAGPYLSKADGQPSREHLAAVKAEIARRLAGREGEGKS